MPSHTEHLRKRGNIWYAWIFDADGVKREASTGCTDKTAAKAVLRQWEQQARDSTDTTTLNDALGMLLEDREQAVRQGKRSPKTLRYYKIHAGHLVRGFGNETLISKFVDARATWPFIEAERRQGAKDATIKATLGVLQTTLRLCAERGLWHGDAAHIVPEAIRNSTYTPRDRSPTRDEVVKLLPHLSYDAAAIVAFILATTAELSAVEAATRDDVAGFNAAAITSIRIRGSKNEARDRMVPIVGSEQRLLLQYAVTHAKGKPPKLFSGARNIRRALLAGCSQAGIAPCSPHDLRRAAGQWLLDQDVPMDVVSAILGHSNVAITQKAYVDATKGLASRMARAMGIEDPNALRVTPLDSLPLPCRERVGKRGSKGNGNSSAILDSSMISVSGDGIEPPTRKFSIIKPRQKSRQIGVSQRVCRVFANARVEAKQRPGMKNNS